MSNPRDALHLMALLTDRLSSVEYQTYMDFFQISVDRSSSGPVILDPVTGKISGRYFCQREIKRIGMAEAYYVTRDMTPLVTFASAGLDESDTFRHDLWPTDFGFLLLEEPYLHREARGRVSVTKAITWGRQVANGLPGTLVTLYTDLDDDRDEINTVILEHPRADPAKFHRAIGRLQVSHVSFLPDGHSVGPALIHPAAQGEGEYDLGSFAALPLAEDADNDRRFILALLMMFNQTLVRKDVEPGDRATVKRMRRMNLPSDVTVVQLRRHEGSRREGESLVEWSHRWVTRGHWAWRKCSEQHPDAQEYDKGFRVRVWINAYIKGPESAPFKQSTKIYSLSR